ncbi:MAG: desulfoferrodoxin [Acidobacteria bacterium]|nr:desulfoferrodoxin [Acidobacteriota bacterium]
MTKRFQIHKCEVCGNIVEVLHPGKGQLVCCGQPMKLFEEQTEEQGYEKHVPVIEKTEKGLKVKVGSIPHPMEEKHHIEWVQLIADDRSYRKFLTPGDAPEAIFEIETEKVSAREFCNIHGLWKGGS